MLSGLGQGVVLGMSYWASVSLWMRGAALFYLMACGRGSIFLSTTPGLLRSGSV